MTYGVVYVTILVTLLNTALYLKVHVFMNYKGVLSFVLFLVKGFPYLEFISIASILYGTVILFHGTFFKRENTGIERTLKVLAPATIWYGIILTLFKFILLEPQWFDTSSLHAFLDYITIWWFPAILEFFKLLSLANLLFTV